MIPLSVTMNLELDPWTDLREAFQTSNLLRAPDGNASVRLERIGLLPNATHSGRACVELFGRTTHGLVVMEAPLRNFRMASAALLASPVAQLEDL